jgi:DNA-binding protein HU-beta
MNKAELIEAIASRTGVTRRTVSIVVDALTETVSDSLATGEKVTLVGFGTFLVQRRKARQGISPQTGTRIQIPAKEVPKFKPGRSLRESVE